jgi:glycolate oxidase FAD binding subunit
VNDETTRTIPAPGSVAELVDAVRAAPRALAVGAGTKPRLAAVGPDVTRISTLKLAGIVDYEPSEFTFTALAGTPVREVMQVLAERGQYLPFDPLLAEAGATLGGTVAAGLSGPGRFRYGGLRDFILGVRFVDGDGRLLRLGGRVVKNAAGFDVPKFFVGSAGRFGVMAELTFKVFPKPATLRTVRLEAKDAAAKARIFSAAGRKRWELDALEAPVDEPVVYARIGGPAEALEALVGEILRTLPGAALGDAEAQGLWRQVTSFGWAHAGGTLVKVALRPAEVPEFAARVQATDGARGWIGAAGNVGYVAAPAGGKLPVPVGPAVTLRGAGPLWTGARSDYEIVRAVKRALDPAGRFPGLGD